MVEWSEVVAPGYSCSFGRQTCASYGTSSCAACVHCSVLQTSEPWAIEQTFSCWSGSIIKLKQYAWWSGPLQGKAGSWLQLIHDTCRCMCIHAISWCGLSIGMLSSGLRWYLSLQFSCNGAIVDASCGHNSWQQLHSETIREGSWRSHDVGRALLGSWLAKV